MSIVKKFVSAGMMLTAGITIAFADPVLVAEWNWTDDNGAVHEYGVFNYADASWNDASAQVADGWHLATVTSKEEQESMIIGLDGLRGEFWLGAFQVNRKCKQRNPLKDWQWVTGETWNYNNWAPGEPNDFYGKNSEQHLATWSLWGTENWLWNDEGCTGNIAGFVVERSQPVPEPGLLTILAMGLASVALMPRRRNKVTRMSV